MLDDLAYKLNLTKSQLLALGGFVLILVSIPLSFSLAKNSQIFRSRADEVKKGQSDSASINKSTVTKPQEVPATSPLSELENQISESGQPTAEPTPTLGSLNTAFGPTLNVRVALEGKPPSNQAAKVFVGIAAGVPTTKPAYILTFTVDFPASGIFSGLSLAGLNPSSTYTAYLKGPAQIDSAVSFSMSPTETNLNSSQPVTLLSGDLNEDNTINSADYTLAQTIYGVASTNTSLWNPRADFNSDGIINNIDLSLILKNFGKTGASGVWYSSPPSVASGSATPATGGPSGGYWIWVPSL